MAAKKKTAGKATKTIAKAGSPDATTVSTTVKKPTAKKAAAKKTANKKKVTNKVTVANTTLEEPQTAKAASKKKAVAKKATVKKAPPKGSSGSNFKTFEPYKLAKGEEYMTDEQLDHFRAILQDWKISLMQEVDRTVGHMKSDATNFPDPNDRATQEEEFSLELRTRDRERKLIKKIDESMAKIDDDEYGYCDGCGVEIGIRRLEARPTANMCIECKTLEEIREKQIA
ncbi:RNA polymerase-binding protein DksA [Chromatiales bacterium (ex Bugula neritina AB1)]|nr:RNA polymerase-binding protein DksA [Chromatiales bacterium (ex Bugula neritina AB1)]